MELTYIVVGVEEAGLDRKTRHLDLMEESEAFQYDREGQAVRLMMRHEFHAHVIGDKAPHWAIMQWRGGELPAVGSRVTVRIDPPDQHNP